MLKFCRAVFNQVNLTILAWVALGAALVPFLLLACYTHPSADDYWLTNMVIATDAWQAQWDIRQNWSGRYFSLFLASFNPLVYNAFNGYKIIALLMLICTYGALLVLVKTFLSGGLSRQVILLISLVLLVLHVGFMPAVSQGYYWLSGSLSYQTANIFLLLLLAALGHFYQIRDTPQQVKYSLLITLLLFISIGCNETNMVLIAFLMSAFLVVDSLMYRHLNYTLLYLLVITAICCSLVYFAPGNAIRLQEYPANGNLFFAGTYAVAVALNNILNWLAATPLIALTLLFIPYSLKLARVRKEQKYVHPAVAILLFFLSLVVSFFVAYWSKGSHAPPRVQNNIYLLFIIGWFLTLHHGVAYLHHQYALQLLPVPRYVVWLICIWVGLLLFYNRQSNIRTAYGDLLSGRAARYNQEMNARYQFLQNSNCQICAIPKVRNMPATIFFEELPADTTWKNRYFSAYFGKKLMRLRSDTTLIENPLN